MYVQVVRNQHYPLSIREVLIHELAELMGKAEGSALECNGSSSPAPQRLTSQEDVGRAFPFVLVVL